MPIGREHLTKQALTGHEDRRTAPIVSRVGETCSVAPTDESGQTAPHASPLGTTPPTRPPAEGAGPNARMPRWLPRAMVLALALIAVFQLGSWAFHQLIGLLTNILIAFFLALAIEPAVSKMAARGMRRGSRLSSSSSRC